MHHKEAKHDNYDGKYPPKRKRSGGKYNKTKYDQSYTYGVDMVRPAGIGTDGEQEPEKSAPPELYPTRTPLPKVKPAEPNKPSEKKQPGVKEYPSQERQKLKPAQ